MRYTVLENERKKARDVIVLPIVFVGHQELSHKLVVIKKHELQWPYIWNENTNIYIYFLSLHLKQFGSSRITNNHMWNLKNKKKIYLIILINFKRKFILSLDSWKLYRIYWKKVFIILYAWCFIKGCVYVESMERKKVSNLWFFFMLVILKIRSSDKLIIFRLSHFLNWTSDLIRCHSFSIISD